MESHKKALSITSFIIVMVCLLTAIISDIAIFSNVLLTILGGIIISVIVFVFLVAAFVVSFILIFGFYLVGEYGFWPLNLSFSLFKEILNDIQITADQIATFRVFRIIFLVLCIIALILSIIALHKDEMIPGKVPLKGMSRVAMIFAIMGIVVAAGMLAVTSMI